MKCYKKAILGIEWSNKIIILICLLLDSSTVKKNKDADVISIFEIDRTECVH